MPGLLLERISRNDIGTYASFLGLRAHVLVLTDGCRASCPRALQNGSLQNLGLSYTEDDLDYSEETAKPKANNEASSSASLLEPPETESRTVQKKDQGAPADGEKEDANSSNLYRIDSGLLPFPEKLMALLDGNQVSGT
jgi:hypothetical protein